jgi:hypothetical protein
VKQKATCVLLIPTLASVLLTTSCATLTRSRTQRIPVTSSPVGATVIVNGAYQGVTPLELGLDRKQKDQVIRIESPGYTPLEIRTERKLSGGVLFGNFLLGLIGAFGPALGLTLRLDLNDPEGIIVYVLCAAACCGGLMAKDTRNGKAYALSPRDLTVTLTKADGTPRVDTMFVDADDFQNIKWIRVRRD